MVRYFKQFTNTFGSIPLIVGLCLLVYDPWYAFLPLALWIGWLQIGSY